MTKSYFSFIRVSKEKYIDRLLKEGQLYLNSVEYFRGIESKDGRGDFNDSRDFLYQGKVTLKYKEKIIGRSNNAQLYLDKNTISKGNIFCLTGLEQKHIDNTSDGVKRISLSEKLNEFGESILLIYDPYEFLKRVDKVLKSEYDDFIISPVTYYNSKNIKVN